MNVIDVKLSDLKPYENNPRLNKEAVEFVANSIQEFGFKVPIVIDKDNVIVCGHTRYLACQELGYDKVPCVIADDLSDEQIKAFRLADNKVAEKSEWDYEKLSQELESIYDIDMDELGFDGLYDDMEDINDKEDKTLEKFEHKLKCDKVVLILTDEEYQELFDRFSSYVKENGVSFGFMSELMKS